MHPTSVTALSLWLLAAAATASAQEPHAAHMPRAGGEFRAAAGDAFHVEGVFAEQRRFRLLISDRSGNPLSVEQMRAVDARVFAGGSEAPLVPIEVDRFFEARIPTLTLPADIIIQLRTDTAGPAETLTFTFADYSVDTLGLSVGAPVEIPSTLQGIADALRANLREGQIAVDRADFLAVLAPEDRIHDLLLAIEPHIQAIPPPLRRDIEGSRTSAIRAGWLLHTAIDYGNVQQAAAAFAMLSGAIDAISNALKGVAP